jgi:FtsZ-interacting cell division protein ZipA
MRLDMRWLYVVGGVVLVFVIFQAWDRRHRDVRFTRQERSRVDREAALYSEETESGKQRRAPP